MNKKNKASRGTLGKILRYIKGYRLLLALALLLGAVNVTLALYIPLLIGDTIDLMLGQGLVDMSAVAALLTRAALCVLIAALAGWIMNVINNKITFNVVRDIRRDAFSKIEILPLGYIDTHPTGETVSRVISDVDQFADGLLMGFSQLFTGILTIVGAMVFMIAISPSIALAVVVLTPLSMFIAAFIAKRTHAMFTLKAKTNAEQTAFIDEAITGQRVISAFGNQTAKKEQFDEINERLADCSLKAIFYSAMVNPSTRFVNNIVYAVVTIIGAFSVIAGGSGAFFAGVTIGNLATLLSYVNQYTKPFNEISGVITEFQNSLACADRIFALIEEEPEIPDASDAFVVVSPSGRVTLDNVSFSYVPEKPLIQELSLDVASGKRIAIVGPTGCGKTTLINLIMRFYDVKGGEIRMDFADENGNNHSANIKDITRKSMRASYGMVLQETWLKRGTIKENLLIGKPNATDEELEKAARASHAHSFIKRLPNGYNTVIGEDGGSLSQGQKQLLCITRVMLCLPPMLILDEATSSIDTRTEQKIQAAFSELMNGRTSFIVAHRLSTIREADTILVMKDGNVIEKGTHNELIAKNGFYAKLSAAGNATESLE